ncbi:helix-turn-helix domain-containing protein [Pantoea rodasii]|uniref:helix-turn-helix domain-containing protein n=1 Tax=Pantoea rodasii TaxID=1076549 RepID=UPI000FFBBF04|nr:helix-turn-helix domain-containing protein [Pantoea rodasii]
MPQINESLRSHNSEQQKAARRRLGEGVTVSAFAREFSTSRQTIMRLRNGMIPDI